MVNKINSYLTAFVRFVLNQSWSLVIILLFVLYIFGFIAMTSFEETEVLEHYTWWFIVTITTIGYGDVAPTSTGGQNSAIIIILLGLGTASIIIGKIAGGIITMNDKKKKGLLSLNVEGHILIMGYHKNDTPKIVEEILGDSKRSKREIILCSSSIETNPFDNSNISFVKGELASDDVLKRACADKACKVIIHGNDDNQSFFTAYAFREINKYAHMVVYMQNDEHQKKIKCLDAVNKDYNQVILPSSTYLVVQEMQDPESSYVLQHLMSNLNGATLYRVDIPVDIKQKWEFRDLYLSCREKLNITIIAIKNTEIVNHPPMESLITGGMSLFYVGEERKNISWEDM